MKRHLVIGCKGEVGSAVLGLLSEKDPTAVEGIDRDDFWPGIFDVLHVCIPWSKNFAAFVDYYQEKCSADRCLTVIHSTVPLGTSERLGAVHSPIRGVHPHLLESLKTFVKYFGGARAQEAAEIFNELGVETRVVADARNTEALKLWCTTGYGINIIIEKTIHEFCERHGLDFETVYADANRTYNEGFRAIGLPQFQKYELKHVPGPIGGHCVLPNCELLGGEIAEFVSSFGKVPA